ncbi:hypothetical protein SPHINGO361_140418 [Sphingomonas sp. EC-HK361]|nr:hypothetical protein SPHINGO361_140418 [Sphingomonas sp. EC-HK361]
MAAGLPPDILHHPLGRGLHQRFCIGGFGLHLRSFVTTTKPKPSLHHNLKSVPLALTADTRATSPLAREDQKDTGGPPSPQRGWGLVVTRRPQPSACGRSSS